MSLTANVPTPEMPLFPQASPLEFGVAAGAHLYTGAMAALNTAGRFVRASADTTLIIAGRCDREADNTSGADDAIKAKVRPGIFRWANGDSITTASRGLVCYAGDDDTVYSTDGGATRPKAGVIVDVDSSGVWVATGYNMLSNPAATPSGTLQKKTLTVTNASLTDAVAGQAQALNIGSALPAAAMVVACDLNLTTDFSGGSVSSVTCDVGWSGSTQAVIHGFDAKGSTAPARYSQGATAVHHPVAADAQQLIATFTPDGGHALSALTGGALTIDVYFFVAF